MVDGGVVAVGVDGRQHGGHRKIAGLFSRGDRFLLGEGRNLFAISLFM